MSYTALVLGAGASMPYGFPSGEELKQEVIEQGVAWTDTLPFQATDVQRLRQFLESLSGTPLGSIDALLAANQARFGDVGVLAMAWKLLRHEQKSKPDLEEHKRRPRPGSDKARTLRDHIYQTMFRQLVDSTKPIEDINFGNVKVVTFNYDRSLEYYFLNGLMNTFCIDESTAFQKLRTLQVHHVYGSLGDLSEADARTGRPATLLYGEKIEYRNFGIFHEACKHIRVTPSPRNDVDTFEVPRSILSRAEAIGYIGFSFDKTNVERLGGSKSLGRMVQSFQEGRTPRLIFATCMGMSQHDAVTAARRTGSVPEETLGPYVAEHGLPPNFFRITGDQLLLETGLLTSPTTWHIKPRHLLNA